MVESHRKLLRRFEQFMHLHELTFSCFQRRPLLANDDFKKIFAATLNSACLEERFQLIAFVFMPEHVHLLVRPQTSDARVSRLLARSKQPASKQVREILERHDAELWKELTVHERPGKLCFRLWQEGAGFDRNLFSPKAISKSIDYVHTNAVDPITEPNSGIFPWLRIVHGDRLALIHGIQIVGWIL